MVRPWPRCPGIPTGSRRRRVLRGRPDPVVADDHTLRLWAGDGGPLATLDRGKFMAIVRYAGRPPPIRGETEIGDGRLWDQRRTARRLRGHTDQVRGPRRWPTAASCRGPRTAPCASGQPTAHPAPSSRDTPARSRAQRIIGDGRMLSWSRDHTLRLWGLDGASLATLEGHDEPVHGAKVTPRRPHPVVVLGRHVAPMEPGRRAP